MLCCRPLSCPPWSAALSFHSGHTVTRYGAIQVEITLRSLRMWPSDLILPAPQPPLPPCGQRAAGMGAISGFRSKDTGRDASPYSLPPLKVGQRSAHDLALNADGSAM